LHDGVAAATINTRKAIFNLQTILRQKNFWIISFSTFVRYGVYAAVQALWAGPFLMEVMQYSTVKTGNLILLMNVGFIAGAPFWGALSDRVLKTRKWIVIFGTAVFASITVSFAVVPPDVNLLVMVSVFFAYGFMASTGQLMYPHIKALMPLEMAGAAMTGINFFTMLGPAIFLQGLGILMQALFPLNPRSPAAFDTAFLLCTGCLVVVAFFYLFTKEGTVK
jgi:sugar phosphate permease